VKTFITGTADALEGRILVAEEAEDKAESGKKRSDEQFQAKQRLARGEAKDKRRRQTKKGLRRMWMAKPSLAILSNSRAGLCFDLAPGFKKNCISTRLLGTKIVIVASGGKHLSPCFTIFARASALTRHGLSIVSETQPSCPEGKPVSSSGDEDPF
jgi:hypothetical protein